MQTQLHIQIQLHMQLKVHRLQLELELQLHIQVQLHMQLQLQLKVHRLQLSLLLGQCSPPLTSCFHQAPYLPCFWGVFVHGPSRRRSSSCTSPQKQTRDNASGTFYYSGFVVILIHQLFMHKSDLVGTEG